MNNRHRRVARQLLAEIANLICGRYVVTAEESARQIQTMIKTNSVNYYIQEGGFEIERLVPATDDEIAVYRQKVEEYECYWEGEG